jgi:hypothetical protein
MLEFSVSSHSDSRCGATGNNRQRSQNEQQRFHHNFVRWLKASCTAAIYTVTTGPMVALPSAVSIAFGSSS